jgi:YVTN family beta-propeller protein
MSAPNKPLSLKELDIPGRTGPVSQTPLIWGINRGALLNNFPLQGLLCRAGPWGTMNIGDILRIFLATNVQVGLEIVSKDEVNTELQMFVEAKHLLEGVHDISYAVTRLGQTEEPSEVMKVRVKLTRPGGPDTTADPGHPGLVMSIPEEILKGGIDEDNVGAGVAITISKADGAPPYLFASAGDKIQLMWGGIFLPITTLTQEQAEGKTPIIVEVDEATIRKAGDSDVAGIAVAFEVYDCVDNRSEDWRLEQRVAVKLNIVRLGAPILKEAVNNVLDVDKLGDADGTSQIVAINLSSSIDFAVGDTPVLRIRGTPREGPPIDLQVRGEALVSVPSIPEINIPNAVLRELAQSQITVSYILEKADGSDDRESRAQFINAIGEIHRLAAPVALDAKQGAIDPLDPDLKQVTIEIAFASVFAIGQAIKLFWLGTRPDLSPYLPNLNLRPITQGDMDAQLPLQIIVDMQHLTPIIGGKLELYYQLLIDDSVLGTMTQLNQTHAIRESIHADILQIGEPRKELPEPKVDGVVDGVLPADTNSTTLTVEYLKTFKDDIVTRFWEGSITGVDSDWVKLSTFTAGEPVPFPIKGELIKGNEGGTVEARYHIVRAAGGTSYSDTLKFSVGAALDLQAPKIKEAPNDTNLDPLDALSALTAVVDSAGLLLGDTIIVTWTGAPGSLPAGSHTTAPWTVTTLGRQEIPLDVSVIPFNLVKSITLSCTVTRGSQEPKESPPRTLAVLQLRVDLSHSPKITQAANGGDGTVLDVSTLTGPATLRGGFWPHIAVNQRVWMVVSGTKKDGTEYTREVWRGPSNAVNALWISQGYLDATVSLVDMQSLKNLSQLLVTFMTTLDRSTDESQALIFPVRTYTVKAVEDAVQVKFTNAPYVVAQKGRLKDIDVQLSNLDGTPVQGLVTLVLPADFSFCDGESGSRDFPSDSEGKISISGVMGAQTSGSYTLLVSKGEALDEAPATVTVQSQLKNIPIGGGSWEVVISLDGTRGYVTSWQKNNISIFDTSTHEVIKTVEDIPFAFGIALSPDERFCYVSNRDTNKVSIIDLILEERIHTMDTGPGPVGVILSKDGQWLFVCNFDSDTVTKIDLATYEVSTIVTGQRPRHGAASPDGKSVYICNAESPDISVIDVETGSFRSIPLSDGACSVTFSQSGEIAYAVMDSKVAIIDVAREELIRYVGETGGRGIAVNRSGEHVFVTEVKSSMLVRVNTLTGAAGPYFKLGETPCQIASSTNGKSLYVCNNETNDVSWVEL